MFWRESEGGRESLTSQLCCLTNDCKDQRSHTIAEKLIKPACVNLVQIMIGEEAAHEVDTVPMLNNTVTRDIAEMSTDIWEITAGKMMNSFFSLQVDDSTDSRGKCHLIAFVCYIDGTAIVNQFLFSRELKPGVLIFLTLLIHSSATTRFHGVNVLAFVQMGLLAWPVKWRGLSHSQKKESVSHYNILFHS